MQNEKNDENSAENLVARVAALEILLEKALVNQLALIDPARHGETIDGYRSLVAMSADLRWPAESEHPQLARKITASGNKTLDRVSKMLRASAERKNSTAPEERDAQN